MPFPESDDLDSYFGRINPSPEVQRFLTECPNSTWQESLTYILDNWPQRRDGLVDYLIEGGAAIKLLHPERQEPNDVDIISRNMDMMMAFNGTNKIDVHYLYTWYARRLPPMSTFDPEPGRFLLDLNETVSFQGRQVLILNSLGLAVAKTMDFDHKPKRYKDLKDLELLNQDSSQVQELIGRIRSAYPQIKS